ncbi:MAG: glycosyltransferase [Tildeniella torsiva UHER 1998/13D]|nr:glycosyltransferase [Tildeniella torsiva UHER 1998/13D]
MRIGIDIRPLVLGASGGISQLVKGTFEHLFALYPEHYFFVFCTPFNRMLIDYENEHVNYLSLPISTYYYQLDKATIGEDLDVLFRAYPMEDTLTFPLSKQIYLIPDIQHEEFPGFFSEDVLRARRESFSKALREAGAIGTISEFARSTLLNFPGTRCTDIFLMEPSLQDLHQDLCEVELTDLETQLVPDGDYFIFPANLWKHKNHRALLQAFSLFIEKTGRDVKLVLTGYQEGWVQLFEAFPELPVVHLGFVRPEFLRILLGRAKALVFFSLYEGFGMPLLEAFNAGTPVICSNTTSLPEVGKDAVLTCDPTDIKAIANLMEQILTDGQLRDMLIKRGKDRLSKYSWDKAAHNLIAACERVRTRIDQSLQVSSFGDQTQQPLVSIVTPSYNQGRFLRKTIESVISQNYSNLEYFIFDGGSTDDSIDILKSYGDRFSWISAPDKGQTDAINKGMRLANGEILAYLNSDDVLLPGTIEKVVHFFNQNPDCDLVYGKAFYIDESDQIIGHYKTADYSLNRLVEDCMVCQPAAFWRSRVKDKIGLFDEALNYAMDYDYWLRIATQCGNICFLPDSLACSRLYPETKTCSARAQIYSEIFNISRKHVGYVHENYYQGLWHYLIFEKDNSIARLLRRYPKLYRSLYKLHYKLSNSRQESIGKTFVHLLLKARGKLKGLIKKYSSRFIPLKLRATSFDNVNGFWQDNWLSPEVTIPIKKLETSQDLYIAGIAPIDLEMTVYVGNQTIDRVKVLAHQYRMIKLSVIFLEDSLLKIKFSKSVKDSDNRRISFLLQATNLFSEKDIG